MLFASKSLTQAAALAYVRTGDGIHVALVTSRRRQRLILPKGWPMKDRPLSAVATLEAHEEAGVLGEAAAEPAGVYEYMKQVDAGYDVRCRVLVFPLEARLQLLDWKERKQRQVLWRPIAEASRIADDAGVRRLLGRIAAAPAAFPAAPASAAAKAQAC